MSELLEQVYASAPVDKTIHHTLVIRAGNVVRRLVDGYSNLSARLENGTLVTYEKSFLRCRCRLNQPRGSKSCNFRLITCRAIHFSLSRMRWNVATW